MDEVFTHLDDLTIDIEKLINKEEESIELVIDARVFIARFVSLYTLLKVI